MNWPRALRAGLVALGGALGILAMAWGINWAGETFGPVGAIVVMVTVVVTVVAVGAGLGDRDR